MGREMVSLDEDVCVEVNDYRRKKGRVANSVRKLGSSSKTREISLIEYFNRIPEK